MARTQYVAMFETGERGRNYFRFAYLEHDDGEIPPPVIPIGKAEYVYAQDQQEIAHAFGTSQQNVSRWLKNKPTAQAKE